MPRSDHCQAAHLFISDRMQTLVIILCWLAEQEQWTVDSRHSARVFNLRDRNIFSALSSLVTCVLVQDTLCHLCALLSVPHGFYSYSGLVGTKSSFKPQFAAPIFQYPVVITIIIPASLAAEACGWGGVDRWILAVSLHLSLCFQQPPTHQHQ